MLIRVGVDESIECVLSNVIGQEPDEDGEMQDIVEIEIIASCLAQDMQQTKDIIYEVAQDFSQDISYVVVEEIPSEFMQLCFDGKFGEYMDIATINEVSALKALVGEQSFNNTKSLNELRILGEIINNQLAMVEIYEVLLNG